MSNEELLEKAKELSQQPAPTKMYAYLQLEDMLGQVFAGRASVATIDELINWLQVRRIAAQLSEVPGYKIGCALCGSPKWNHAAIGHDYVERT